MKYAEVQNCIGGAFVSPDAPLLDVYDPSSGSVLSRVPLSLARDVDAAVDAARAAFPGWSATPIKERVQVLYRYKTLLEQHIDELAALVTEENGKIASEARAEVLEVGRAHGVCLLAAADRHGRGARGEPRRRVSRRAISALASWRRSRRSTFRTWCRTGRSPTRSPSATA